VLLYPLILLRYYVIREYVYFTPFLYGVVGGAIFYAIPYMYLRMFIGWDMSREGIWLFIVLLAALKALLGEGGKRLIAKINNRTIYKWRYYLPLGIGFSYALLLSCFLRPLTRLYLSFRSYLEMGTPIPVEHFFSGTSISGIILTMLTIVAVVEMEIGLTVLTGLSRNRNSLKYWIFAVILSWFTTSLVLYPWSSYWVRLAMVILAFAHGLALIIKNRDAFRKYIGRQKTFRSFN
jgi:hypothetical protein